MHSFDITLENLSKIEGHVALDIKVRNKKVKEVKFKITENKRFFEEAARGQKYKAAPQLMSRICGTCSIAHLMCCIEALEHCLGVKPTKQALLLKKLTVYGLMIRDHALHLYFFSLPDVIGKDSILDFDEKNEFEHELIHDALDIKRVGNNLSTLVAGKAVHAPFPTVGGFLKVPEESGIRKSIEELKSIREKVLKIIRVYAEWKENFSRKTNFVALVSDEFSFLEGEVCSTTGRCIAEQNYLNYIDKVIIPYSTASAFKFEGENFMVGALARMNLSKEKLHPNTKESVKQYLDRFPSENIFDNCLAQAIEILHCVDHSIEILSSNKFAPEPVQEVTPKAGTGIGVIEAPRGTLYYKIALDDSGTIKQATVIVPSAQNQINIENDIKRLVEEKIGLSKEKITYEIEKLIRAYDPCMSCTSHFLKVNWK